MEELKNSLAKQLYFYRQVLFSIQKDFHKIFLDKLPYILVFLLYREGVEGQHPQEILLMEET